MFFYSHSLLSKKGPLGNIWIAAFCFKKLKKEEINGTDITSSIDKIMPEVQISYRVLAQLLLGIVKIFSKKVDYLCHDCNEALTNIRRSLIPSQHVLRKKANSEPEDSVLVAKEVTHAPKQYHSRSKKGEPVIQMEIMRATYNEVAITLPERFELDAFDLEVSDGGFVTDTAKSSEEFILQDAEEWTTEGNQGTIPNECYHREMDAYIEYNYDCLTPSDDTFPAFMMDIDLQHSEYFNSNSLIEETQKKAQEVSQQLEEVDYNEIFGANISVGPYSHDEQSEHHTHQVKLQEGMLPNVAGEVQVEDAKNQVKPIDLHSTKPSDIEEPHQKSNLPNDSGFPSPKFAVTTPSKKETSRRLRKRKKSLYDETIVLPNEIIRMWIHDASDLVCKRRKAPHSSLDAWKVHMITNLQQSLMEPLILCNSLVLKNILQKSSHDHSPLKNAPGSIDLISMKNDVTDKFSGAHDCLLEKPSVDTMAELDHSELPIADTDTSYQGKISELLRVNTSYEGGIKEPHSAEISNYGMGTIDLELSSAEKDNDFQDDGWSTRTRAVAQYLYHRFLGHNDQKQKKIQSLACILEGQTRAKCARFFNETLTLKSQGCIDVQQDDPYDGITISATPKLEALLQEPIVHRLSLL